MCERSLIGIYDLHSTNLLVYRRDLDICTLAPHAHPPRPKPRPQRECALASQVLGASQNDLRLADGLFDSLVRQHEAAVDEDLAAHMHVLAEHRHA